MAEEDGRVNLHRLLRSPQALAKDPNYSKTLVASGVVVTLTLQLIVMLQFMPMDTVFHHLMRKKPSSLQRQSSKVGVLLPF